MHGRSGPAGGVSLCLPLAGPRGLPLAGPRARKARLAATTDGGTRWHFLKAPDVRFPNSSGRRRPASVSGVVFASRRHGWLYGSRLWYTRDGGAHWRELSLGGPIDAMAVSAGTAYAEVSSRLSARPSELFRSPAGRAAWARVGHMTASTVSAGLAVSGRAAWFGGSNHVWADADGAHWRRYPFRCRGARYQPYGNTLASSGPIAAASASRVKFLCIDTDFNTGEEGMEVMSSSNGGRTTHLAGRWAPIIGDAGAIAVPRHRARVITFATSAGSPSWLGRSADGGKTWQQVASFTDGFSWNSLSYMSRKVGWIVLGGPALGGVAQLLRTSDAGVRWHQAGF